MQDIRVMIRILRHWGEASEVNEHIIAYRFVMWSNEIWCGYNTKDSGTGTIAVPRGKVIIDGEEEDYFHCLEETR